MIETKQKKQCYSRIEYTPVDTGIESLILSMIQIYFCHLFTGLNIVAAECEGITSKSEI